MGPTITSGAATVSADLQTLFHLQRQASRRIAQTTAAERISKLDGIRREVESNLAAIQAALKADFGKPPEEVLLTEIFPLVSEINHVRQHLAQWMAPRVVPASTAFTGASCQVRYQPRGVVLIISPWNYPFQLALGPLVSAIAAGNCAVVKLSEFSPHTSALAAELVERLFPASEVAVVQGEKEVAQELLQLPFDHVFFTGSPAVGRQVMSAAARHLASVTLELGGKSPAILDASAPLDHAANRITWGKFINAGQTCVAPDYVLVPEPHREEFLSAVQRAIERLYGGPEKSLGNPDYCRLIHDRHLNRLQETLSAALAAGARLAIGGQVSLEERKLAPTVLDQVQPNNPIMQEEIFGPILPVIGYGGLEQALELVNSLPHPLALYIFSRDRSKTERILAETRAGDTVVNDVVVHYSNSSLPFGGVGTSGIGKAHGVYGFQEFSHQRAVLVQPRLTATALLTPPYDRPWLKKLIGWTLKYFS